MEKIRQTIAKKQIYIYNKTNEKHKKRWYLNGIGCNPWGSTHTHTHTLIFNEKINVKNSK